MILHVSSDAASVICSSEYLIDLLIKNNLRIYLESSNMASVLAFDCSKYRDIIMVETDQLTNL